MTAAKTTNQNETTINPGISYEEFTDPTTQLLTSDRQNALNIYCPQPNCRSLIVQSNVATLVKKSEVNLPETSLPPNNESENDNGKAAQDPDMLRTYWQLKDMMDFQNIGFSHTVSGIKYLACADCEFGPLGYHHDTNPPTKECLIAVDRVRYAKPPE